MATAPVSSFRFHHSMLRAKDPEKSRHFYVDLLGMKQVGKFDFPGGKFSLYFFTFTDEPVPAEPDMKFVFSLKTPVVELTHNWGTENDPEFSYANGNSDPGRGFGHLAFTCPDIFSACEKFEKDGVKIIRKPGPMQNVVDIAFIQDPDGYWIELINEFK